MRDTMAARLSRRRFTQFATGAAALGLMPKLHAKDRVPIALQLYSIREECQKDLPGTLAAVAKMGYDGVEFAGYHGRTAAELKKMLADLNLKPFSTHINIKTLTGDELQKTVEFNLELGNSRLTVPSLPAATSIDEWVEHAHRFNEIADKLKPHRMRVGFHNHARELELLDGKRPWDVFAANTTADVTLQMDLAHFPAYQLDPVAYIRRDRGRVRMMHCKDHPQDPPYHLLGDGDIQFKPIFEAAEAVGGIEVYIIEQERYPAPLTPMECVARCLQNFRKLHG
jgi:sugar phosphate isomerase/epimerase